MQKIKEEIKEHKDKMETDKFANGDLKEIQNSIKEIWNKLNELSEEIENK